MVTTRSKSAHFKKLVENDDKEEYFSESESDSEYFPSDTEEDEDNEEYEEMYDEATDYEESKPKKTFKQKTTNVKKRKVVVDEDSDYIPESDESGDEGFKKVAPLKGGPKFTGMHITIEQAGKDSRVKPLKGLPQPTGMHLRFR